MAEKRADVETPDSWRDSVAEHLAAWADQQPKGRRTDRALATALGVSNFTYNRLKKKKGPLGLHVLVQLRKKLGVSVDELLGLEEIRPAVAASLPAAPGLSAEEIAALKDLAARELAQHREPEEAPQPARSRPPRRRSLIE